MAPSPHIVILGAGLIGLSSADALLRRGARVTLLERGGAVMRGASFANSGMIHPSQACSWSGPANDPAMDAAVHGLALHSVGLLERNMTELGLPDLRDRPAGCYQIFDDAAQAQAACDRLSLRGIDVRGVAPGPATFGRPGLFFAQDRSADAYAYGLALADSVRVRGGTIRLGRDVSLDAGGARVRALIDGEPLDSDAVVLACGAQTTTLLRHVGLGSCIEGVRGWSADFDVPPDHDLPPQPVMDAATRSALTLLSGTLRLSGTWGDASPDRLLSRWSDILPRGVLSETGPNRIRSSLRPVSARGGPVIGPTPHPGLFVNAGHGHMGWTLCAGSGELLADILLGGADPQVFSFDAQARSGARKTQ
ncbi:FAD-dependent oxidoreductase [uncultured Algimonas sp.]|uniref:NAD(P)/FAD-dependent oxidoreductase n=1 Tax=uncultured Algimonas sp. TaxID=1547920 RepID=UPI00261469DE|nr:FAD-dependent oxidoreductase [uncultured Algimonas sp.]